MLFFTLSLSPSQNLHVTPWEIDQVQCFISIFWYSALHCAGEQSIHIFQDSWQTTIRHFSPSAFGITKTSPILSQQCGMNILFHIHSSCLSKPVRLTLFLSWITEDDILISWWFSFLRTQWTGAFRIKKKNIKLYDLCHIHVLLDFFYGAFVCFMKQGTWYL